MSIGIIGLGRLGTALAGGLARVGVPDVVVFNRTTAKAEALASECPGVAVAASAAEVFERCDPVFLWTAPPDSAALASEHGEVIARHRPMIVTCASGWDPGGHTPRWATTLPNVNLSTGQGATLVTWGPGLTEADKDAVRAPLAACGVVHEVDAERLSLYAALTSSGPALYARALEIWADALAGRHGLDPEVCRGLVRQTAAGTLTLQEQDAIGAGAVVDRVAHPGGTTEKGLDVLNAEFPRVAEQMLRAMGKWGA